MVVLTLCLVLFQHFFLFKLIDWSSFKFMFSDKCKKDCLHLQHFDYANRLLVNGSTHTNIMVWRPYSHKLLYPGTLPIHHTLKYPQNFVTITTFYPNNRKYLDDNCGSQREKTTAETKKEVNKHRNSLLAIKVVVQVSKSVLSNCINYKLWCRNYGISTKFQPRKHIRTKISGKKILFSKWQQQDKPEKNMKHPAAFFLSSYSSPFLSPPHQHEYNHTPHHRFTQYCQFTLK